MKHENCPRYGAARDTECPVMTAANFITLLRMAGTAGLLFPRPLSPVFFGLYTLTGLTDVLDGWLARKTGTSSEFGARLDSIADLLFYGAVLLRLFPVLWEALPAGIWFAVVGILLLRLGTYALAAKKFHCFAALHTWQNKPTGGMVFLLPLMLAMPLAIEYCWAVCVVALAAALEELAIHLCRDSFRADIKSIVCVYQNDSAAGEYIG